MKKKFRIPNIIELSRKTKMLWPGQKILFKKQLFDLEVKGQGPTKVITVHDTQPYGPAHTYQISLTCKHSRINILQCILTKLGTYLVLKRIWNPIDFQGQRVKFLGEGICHALRLQKLENNYPGLPLLSN
jgi:hypothetical protein